MATDSINIQVNFKSTLKNRQWFGMYNISWQVIPFPYNANKERIFVAITNRSSQVKFIVVVSSCTSTFGKLKEIWQKRRDQYQKLSYNIEPEIEILFASLVFAISVSTTLSLPRFLLLLLLSDCHTFLSMLALRIWCYIRQNSVVDDFLYSH